MDAGEKEEGGEGVVWKKKEQKWEEMMTYEGPKYWMYLDMV